MNPINDEIKRIYCKEKNTETFLTSCFVFYYGKIEVFSENREKSKNLVLTKHFLETKKYKRVIIIDYANVMYVLHDKYRDRQTAAMKFYQYILKQLRENRKIIMVTKDVFIEGEDYTVQTILFIGASNQSKRERITSQHFASEQLCIYLLNFFSPSGNTNRKHISSSIDDVLQWFIMFVLFVYYKKNKIRILGRNASNESNKLTLLTNDSQFFDKNLFGKTENEKANHIDYLRNLHVQHVDMREGKYVAVSNPLEQSIVADFLRHYVVENIHNTNSLECNLSVLIEQLLREKTQNGFFRRHTRNRRHSDYNANFTRQNITKHRITKYDYKTTNGIARNSTKKCRKQVLFGKSGLKPNYYLYAFIKYIQMYLNTTQDKYGNFYGNYSKEAIANLML